MIPPSQGTDVCVCRAPRPTVLLVSKPLPGLPTAESRSSMGSDSDFDSILRKFPNPPVNTSSAVHPDVRENTGLSANLKRSMLKVDQTTEIHTIDPRGNNSFSHLPDSIEVRRNRTNHRVLRKNNPQTSVRPAHTALRGGPSSVGSSNLGEPPRRKVDVEAIGWPRLCDDYGEFGQLQRARLERERQHQPEEETAPMLEHFYQEFGFNPQYEGKKQYQREADRDAFELIRPGKKRRRWF